MTPPDTTATSPPAAGSPASERLLTDETSSIAACKHRWIRTGPIAFCVGMVLLPASLLIG
ncbi:hypothetical protein [Streptomyces sp. NPDC002889]|uniref:hypothetical protein n=1 Tax=Streptomyces sp. NPDC002889 TaxID=3364669 RepID=UPI00369C1FD1